MQPPAAATCKPFSLLTSRSPKMIVIHLTPWINFFFTRISEREFSLDHLHQTQSTGSHQCLLPFFCAWLLCVLLYFPKQWRICLSHWSWTEYCRALQFHALTTYKSFSLAGYESSRAKWPHSVALLHLTLERLHPLKPGVHLCYLEIFFYFYAIECTITENERVMEEQVSC